MKTLLVYNGGETGDVPRLYLLDGDYSRFDNLYLDRGSIPESYRGEHPRTILQRELCEVLFGKEGTGQQLQEAQPPFQVDFVAKVCYVP